VPVGIGKLGEANSIWYEDIENGLSSMFRILLNDLYADLIELDERVSKLDKIVKQDVQ
jgi:transposase